MRRSRFGQIQERGCVRPVGAQVGDGGIECRLGGDQRCIQAERLCSQHLGETHGAAALPAPPGDDLPQPLRGAGVEVDHAQRQQKALQGEPVLRGVAAFFGARLEHGYRQGRYGRVAWVQGGKRRQELARARANQIQAVGGVEQEARAVFCARRVIQGHRLRNPR